MHRALSLLEHDFLISVHVISVYLLHHLPVYIAQFGPAHGFWMYPMERFNSWITCRVLNRRYPEPTVMASYRLFELSFFLQMSGQLPEGALSGITFSVDDSDSVETALFDDMQW